MPYDLFGTREMTEAINEVKPVGDFFQTTFFSGPSEEHNSLNIDVDIYKGKRKVAPYCRSGSKGTPLDRTQFKTGAFTIPYSRVTRSLRPAEVMLRTAGEHIYSPETPLQRAQKIMAQDMVDVEETFLRMEELQAAQAIINGKLVIKGEEVDAEIDLQRDAALSGNDPGGVWATNTDLFARFRNYKRLVFAKSGYTPNIAIFSPEALEMFFKNDTVQKYLDNRRIDVGQLKQNAVSHPGAAYYGNVFDFDIWEYYELYLDDADNTEKTIVPANTVVLASRNMKCKRHYGPIMDMDVLQPLRRFAKSVKIENPSGRDMIAETAPALINHTPDATAKFTVLGF